MENREMLVKCFEVLVQKKMLGDKIYTPLAICEDKLLANVDITPDTKILVGNIEFAFVLKKFMDIDPSQITLLTKGNKQLKLFASKMGINVVYNLGKKMKFDIIIANPPYKGGESLHQKFFNDCVDICSPGGSVIFLQPATPYFNKKKTQNDAVLEMQGNIRMYKTDVEIVSSSIFKNATNNNDLAITWLEKTEDSDEINSITYKDGTVLKNVPLEDASITGIEPKIYRSIKEKYFSFSMKKGSLFDIVDEVPGVEKIYLGKIRPYRGSGDEMFTLISNKKDVWGVTDKWGINEDISLMDNVYSYVTSNFARFALTFLKFNGNLHRGELRAVPLVPFDRTYTDDELFDMIGLTQTERDTINNFLPDYYG